MSRIKVGIIGYGFSAKCFHLPFILPNNDLEVYAFLQRKLPSKDAGPGDHCTVDFPAAKHYTTPEQFFGDGQIELVIVCSQHDSHASFAEQALRSGKHVVVEKPFTVSSAEADHLLAVAKKTGKVLTVFQNRRYDSDFLTLKDLYSKQVFGEVTECEIHYDVDFPSWMKGWSSPDFNPGDGMMFGLGSHTIDQAIVLFGRPSKVTGFYRSLRGIDSKTDDTFTIILQYKGRNLLVTIKTTVVNPLQQPLKYFIRGYDGSFIKYGEDLQEPHWWKGMKATDVGFGEESSDTFGLLVTKQQVHESQKQGKEGARFEGHYPSRRGDYLGYYRDVVASIKDGAELKVKPEESRDGIRVIELARESAETGRTLDWS